MSTIGVDFGDVANVTGSTVTTDDSTGIAVASRGDQNLAELLGP